MAVYTRARTEHVLPSGQLCDADPSSVVVVSLTTTATTPVWVATGFKFEPPNA